MPDSATSTRRRLTGEHAVVAAVALVAGSMAALLSRLVFPLLSIDNDDAINRLHADAIAHGHLFPPTLGLPNAIRPWLGAVSGDHFVLKYAPVVPGLIAGSERLTGGRTWYLALVAAAVAVVTHLLARELLADRRAALAATLLLCGSPLVVVQSGLLLSYLPTFLFLEAFALLLVRGVRGDRLLPIAGAGVMFGLAFFVRPYDAVLIGAPLGVWAFPIRRPRPAAWLAFGGAALLPLAGFLAFNAAATGSALRPPFSFLEPHDALGFGTRKLWGTDHPHHFGPAQGLNGVAQHLALLGLWASGGVVLVGAALAAAARRRVSGPAVAVVVTAVVLPVGYLVFWGPWNATVVWGGTRYLGPFYFLPVLLPLCLLAARSIVDLLDRRRALGVVLCAAVTVASVAVTANAIRDNLGFTAQNRALVRLVDRPGKTDRLVLASMPTPFLMHPTPVLANRWDASGSVVYAVAGGDRDVDVVSRFAGRTAYRLRFADRFDHPSTKLRARLEAVHLQRGERLSARVALRNGEHRRVGVSVSLGGITRVYWLGSDASYDLDVSLAAGEATVAGRTPDETRSEAKGRTLVIAMVTTHAGRSRPATVAEDRIPVRLSGGQLTMLVPSGPAWTTGPNRAPHLLVTG
jgi:hypothetical protein